MAIVLSQSWFEENNTEALKGVRPGSDEFHSPFYRLYQQGQLPVGFAVAPVSELTGRDRQGETQTSRTIYGVCAIHASTLAAWEEKNLLHLEMFTAKSDAINKADALNFKQQSICEQDYRDGCLKGVRSWNHEQKAHIAEPYSNMDRQQKIQSVSWNP